MNLPPRCVARAAGAATLFLFALAVPLVPAAAQGADASGGGFDGILRTLQLKPKPSPPAPDFVRRSRPASTDFIPTGRPHPERPTKVMTPAEIEAETQALDGARLLQQKRAGVKAPPVPLKPAKGAPALEKTRKR